MGGCFGFCFAWFCVCLEFHLFGGLGCFNLKYNAIFITFLCNLFKMKTQVQQQVPNTKRASVV